LVFVLVDWSHQVKLERPELKKIGVVEENPDVQSSFMRELQGRRVQDTERNLQQHRDAQSSRRKLAREGLR
jgi:hypothetical protein